MSPRLPRRTLLRRAAQLGLGAAGVALVGCGADDDETPAAPVAAPTPSTDDAAVAGTPPERTGVVVVGAGLSGLAAASALRAEGLDAVVLEAQDRIGGRVQTDRELASYPVELGGEFLHGQGHASWRLADDLDLALGDEADFDPDEDLIVFAQGTRWDSDDLEEDADLSAIVDVDLDASAFFDPGAGDQSLGDVIRATGLSPLAQAILIGSEQGEYSAPIDLLSATDTSTQEEAPGADRRIAAGYDQLVIALARELPVFVEQPVSRIEWGDGVRVHHAGGVIAADVVIVTVSVAALQSGAISFDPPLPAEKTDAIDGLGMGRLGKIIAVYDDPPWDAETSGVLHDGLVTTWWMPGLDRDDGPNDTVIGFASERFAAAVEGLSASEIRTVAVRELVQIFGSNAEAPARFRYQAWHENPWIGGGYSYVRVGRVGAREGLAAPLRSELFFAGEATHSTTPATTHGAIESGRRAADEVRATLSNHPAPNTSRPASHALATRTPLIR